MSRDKNIYRERAYAFPVFTCTIAILSVLFIMCVTAAVSIIYPLLRQTMKHNEYMAAYFAAVSAQKYALMKIEADYRWEANDAGGNYDSAAASGGIYNFKVTEYPQDKCCVGEIDNGNQKFYISFNNTEIDGNRISRYLSYNRIMKPSTKDDPALSGRDLQTSKNEVGANTVLIVGSCINGVRS